MYGLISFMLICLALIGSSAPENVRKKTERLISTVLQGNRA